MSFHSRYIHEVRGRLLQPETQDVVTEEDLAPLPDMVRCYIRLSGAVGQPRIHHFRGVWRGKIRQGASDPWMPFTAEQANFINEPARFFHMKARKVGLPVNVFHSFDATGATMEVKLLSLLTLTRASGPELKRAETVTIFNDMCLLAPDSLTDPAIGFEPVDDHAVRAFYTLGDQTVGALLSFNDRCELVDFISDDRLAAVKGGFERMRFSTPVGEYHEFGTRRVFTCGKGMWHPPEGKYAYIELELVDYQVNGPPP